MDSTETIYVVWMDDRDGSFNFFLKKSTDYGETWSSDIKVTDTVMQSGWPRMAIDSNDVLHLLWLEEDETHSTYKFYPYDSDTKQIRYKNSADGGITWSSPITIASNTGRMQYCGLDICVGQADAVHVSYSKYPPSKIFHRRSIDGGTTWSTPVEIGSDIDAARPNVIAADNHGHVYVAFHTWGNTGDIDFVKSNDNGVTWGSAITLIGGYGWPSRAHLAALDDGHVFLTYVSNKYGTDHWMDPREIYIIISSDYASSWGPEIRVTHIGFRMEHPITVIDPDNNINIVWQDLREGNWEIYFTKLDNNGNTLIDDTRLTDDPAISGHPKIVIDSSNTRHVFWHDNRMAEDNYELFTKGDAPRPEPPVADAGPDQTVSEGDFVQFDGSASYDPDGSAGAWEFKADVPSPTWGPGSTSLNGDIYYMGGIPLDPIVSPSSVFMRYGPASVTWSSLPDLPAPRAYLGAATANGKVYAMGGTDGNSSTDTVFEYDPATNIWTSKSPMPAPLEAFGIAVVEDRIYIIGGVNTWLSQPPIASVYEYDPAGDTWSARPDMPTGRENLACAVHEDKIFAIGGDAYGPIAAVEMYDPTTEVWTKKANLSSVRSGLSAETLGYNIYALGGTGRWGLAMNTTEMYNPSEDSWTTAPSMIEPRVYFGSGASGNCIYVMGGSYGPLIVGSPNSTEEYCVDSRLSYEWDFDASVDSDGNGNFTDDIDATGPTPTHIYGDNGVFTVTLKVTDNQNLSGADTCNITILNVDPTVAIESITMDLEIGLRVAGRKYNEVGMTLFEDDIPIGYISIERLPGSPDDQMAWISVSIDFSKSYNATVTYIPEDPPNIGSNPVWIYLKSENGSINKIHHTFNVQQSMKRDSNHPNHIEPWEVELDEHFIGLPFEITAHVTDPGSDDIFLSYSYGSQNVTVTYLNNPLNPDPYPSPEVNPRDIIDSIHLLYEGPGTVLLTVTDDDGGTETTTLTLG